MKNEHLIIDVQERVGTITFNQPEKHNAIDYEGWKVLLEEVKNLGENKDLRVVVFTGSGGRSFSAGADIKDFGKNRKDSVTGKIYSEAFDGALDAIENLPMPTISKINGICVGGGCELSMATDIRVASDKSKFGIPVAKLGILVGYREMKRLISLAGPGNASYILLSGRIFDAEEAQKLGLVNQVVPEDQLDDIVSNLIAEMIPLAPLSQMRHKKILLSTVNNPSLRNLTAEQQQLPFSNFDTEDFKEGQSAFAGRRAPKFIGE